MNKNGTPRLYPDVALDQFVTHDFYREHGRLPEPEEHSGNLGEVKRVPLPLNFPKPTA